MFFVTNNEIKVNKESEFKSGHFRLSKQAIISGVNVGIRLIAEKNVRYYITTD